jgi:hypothetical protein
VLRVLEREKKDPKDKCCLFEAHRGHGKTRISWIFQKAGYLSGYKAAGLRQSCRVTGSLRLLLRCNLDFYSVIVERVGRVSFSIYLHRVAQIDSGDFRMIILLGEDKEVPPKKRIVFSLCILRSKISKRFMLENDGTARRVISYIAKNNKLLWETSRYCVVERESRSTEIVSLLCSKYIFWLTL